MTYLTGATNPGVVAEVLNAPYSIGYSVLDDALKFSLPMANLINQYGTVVTPSPDSVAYAVMEKGGNFDQYMNAPLVDGKSQSCWPMAGYTYFIVRTMHHIGDCARRIEAMQYLYNFYQSVEVQQIAARHGFAVLPDFIRNIVLTKLVYSVKCVDGSFALQQYQNLPTPMLTTSALLSTLNMFLSAYQIVNPTSKFSLNSLDDSRSIWSSYSAFPDTFEGAFTLFESNYRRSQMYTNSQIRSSAFAYVAVVPIYHLNPLTAAPSAKPLTLTTTILVKIYCGQILYWNDTMIQEANPLMKAYLPFKRIMVVVQSTPSDTNLLFSRYLGLHSPYFKSLYNMSNADEGLKDINFAKVLDPDYLLIASDNNDMDSKVTFYDNAIGYYLQVGTPNSYVAQYCADPICATGIVNPASNGIAITLCTLDNSTVYNPSDNVLSSDLMLSQYPGCYPIVGTIDHSVFVQPDAHSCSVAANSISGNSSAYSRVEFSAWIYNGTAIVAPLSSLQLASPSNNNRLQAYKGVCDIQCNNRALGYEYCGYRDCSWSAGDYSQMVSDCQYSSQTRSVFYVLKDGQTCLLNSPSLQPPNEIDIQCVYVESKSIIGIVCYIFCGLGLAICTGFMVGTLRVRNYRVIRRSQPIFIIIFISGAILMNLTIIVYVGPNNDTSCLMRPWCFNISATIMFAPLIMKLHRVDVLFTSNLKKKIIRDTQVIGQVCGLLMVDIILLSLWTGLDTPKAIDIQQSYTSVLLPVTDTQCNTGTTQIFEILMLVFKSSMLAFGVMKAIRTWNVPEDLSEAKYFAIAIYNIAVIGGIGYFLSSFLSETNVEAGVVLRCLGLFMCSTVAVTVIMFFKFLAIDFNDRTQISTSKSVVTSSVDDQPEKIKTPTQEIPRPLVHPE